MLRGFFLSALMVAALGVPSTDATEASFRLRGGDMPVNHAANGYSQSVEVSADGVTLVRVGVPAVAVGAAPGGFEPRPASMRELPDGFRLPARLQAALGADLDAYTRATRVLQWVDRALVLDNSNIGDQDAVSVLLRGGGRCSGLANATAALLTAAGFEARTISGLLVTDDRVVPHRWLECRLPGAGWVPTDPTMGFWVITPRHVVFHDTVTRMPVVEMITAPAALPDYPLIDGVPTRPDRGSELVCRVINSCGAALVATLEGDAGVKLRTSIDQEGRFSGMLPGRWELAVWRDGDIVAQQTLDLGDGAFHSIAVRINDECY